MIGSLFAGHEESPGKTIETPYGNHFYIFKSTFWFHEPLMKLFKSTLNIYSQFVHESRVR